MNQVDQLVRNQKLALSGLFSYELMAYIIPRTLQIGHGTLTTITKTTMTATMMTTTTVTMTTTMTTTSRPQQQRIYGYNIRGDDDNKKVIHTWICRCLWCRRWVQHADLQSPSSCSTPWSSVSLAAGCM